MIKVIGRWYIVYLIRKYFFKQTSRNRILDGLIVLLCLILHIYKHIVAKIVVILHLRILLYEWYSPKPAYFPLIFLRFIMWQEIICFFGQIAQRRFSLNISNIHLCFHLQIKMIKRYHRNTKRSKYVTLIFPVQSCKNSSFTQISKYRYCYFLHT